MKERRDRKEMKADQQRHYEGLEELPVSRKAKERFRRTPYAVKRMIQAQAEQIRENPAEYVARKYKIGGDAVDKGNATELPEQKG